MPSTASKTTMSAITSSPLRRPLSTIPVNTAIATARGHVGPPIPAAALRPSNHYRPVASFVPSQKVKDVVTNVSRHVWRTPVLRLRERQSLALSTLLENRACDSTLLFVDRTGVGKSHVMRVAGTCIRGIIVVTAPTLALEHHLVTLVWIICCFFSLSYANCLGICCHTFNVVVELVDRANRLLVT
jgi:hypothetical protein